MIKLDKKLKGSITVEAAFSFTLTVFVLFLMLGPLLIIKTNSDVLITLNNASKVRCNYEMIKNGLNDLRIYNKITDKINDDEVLKNNFKDFENVVNFGALISDFDKSYDDTKSEYRNIKLIYNMNPEIYNEDTNEVLYDFKFWFSLPYNLFNVDSVRKRLVNNRRAFIGASFDRFSGEEASGDFVYVANNHIYSNKYHLFLDCTYLKKITEQVKYSDISIVRNDEGRIYTKCDYCFKKIKIDDNTMCYITSYGERFHYRNNCPLMTAYVTKIPKELIGDYDLTLCTRCSNRENK